MNTKQIAAWIRVGRRVGLGLGLVGLLLVGLVACGPAAAPSQSAPQRPPESVPAGGTGGGSSTEPPVDAGPRLILRDATVVLVVDDTLAARAAIEGLVTELGAGGFVVASSQQGGTTGTTPTITIEMRIPAERYDEALTRIVALARTVRTRDEHAQDVTEEYVDVGARIEALEAARKRLLEIMAQANKTADLLEIEQQLTQREAEIAALRGRQQYIEGAARLAHVTVTLVPHVISQVVLPEDDWGIVETAQSAYGDLIRNLQRFARFLVYVTITWGLWIVVGAVLVWIVRVWFGRRLRAAAQDRPPVKDPPDKV